MKDCKTCAAAWNTLNGRYCGPLKKIVEYCVIPPCNRYDYVNDNRDATSERDREQKEPIPH